MDTRTGEILSVEEVQRRFGEDPKQKKFFKPMEVEPTPTQLLNKKVGRNDPCPCGSGVKFKRCCYVGPRVMRT